MSGYTGHPLDIRLIHNVCILDEVILIFFDKNTGVKRDQKQSFKFDYKCRKFTMFNEG